LYGRTLGHIKPLKERVRIAKSVDEIREALEAWLTEDNQEFDVTVTRINDCHTTLDGRPNARFHA